MGDNVFLGDRNGVRTPMQWSSDRNAGFSRANPQRLYLPVNIDPEYHYETVNVEAQQNNSHSLLWWTKRLIQQRKQFRAFGSGTLEFLYPSNRKVLAFIRQFDDENDPGGRQPFALRPMRGAGSRAGSRARRRWRSSAAAKFPTITEQLLPALSGAACFLLVPPAAARGDAGVAERQRRAAGVTLVQVGPARGCFHRAILCRSCSRIVPQRCCASRPWFLGQAALHHAVWNCTTCCPCPKRRRTCSS